MTLRQIDRDIKSRCQGTKGVLLAMCACIQFPFYLYLCGFSEEVVCVCVCLCVCVCVLHVHIGSSEAVECVHVWKLNNMLRVCVKRSTW